MNMAKNYLIKAPPQDEGPQPLFRVVYSIDVDAADEMQAAKKAYRIMIASDSLAPVLVVIDSAGKSATIDLSIES
jgi:hypothetical protein